MSKRFGAVIVSVACGYSLSAFAQSSVTLYGVIDNGVNYATNVNGSHLVSMSSGQMRGDRIGFQGGEDLGAGYKAIFDLEMGFAVQNGTLGQGGLGFGQGASVGLQGPQGKFTMGRLDDLTYDYMVYFSASAYSTALAFHPLDIDRVGGVARVNNALRYDSPDWHGFHFGALYGIGDANPSLANPTASGHTNSAGLSYKNGPLNMAVTYTAQYSFTPGLPGGLASLGANNVFGSNIASVSPANGTVTTKAVFIDRLKTYAAAGEYKIGKFRLRGTVTDTNIQVLKNSGSYRSYEFNPVFDFTPFTSFALSYAYQTFEGLHWGESSAAVNYFLSKRTEVYASVVYTHAYDAGARAVNLSVGTSNSNTAVVTRIGMLHRF